MSVECNRIVGWTVKIQEKELSNDDFDFYNEFTENNKEYDFNGFDAEPNKVYFIVDGMNGEYARLVYAESTGTGDDYCYDEIQYLKLAETEVPEHIFNKLNKAYKKLKGEELDKKLIEHAMWHYWW